MRELRCAGRREDTQQGTLATGVARDCGDVGSVAGWPSGRERNSLQPGQGATELDFPRPAPGEMQSEAARRAGDPSHQSEDPPPEGLGDHGPLAQTNPRRPAGQVMRHHLDRQPGAVGGEARRRHVVQPDAVLEAAYGVLDLGVAAMIGVLGFDTPSDFVRAYPLSREWLALLIRRMDAVAAVCRLAALMSPGTRSRRSHVEFHRRGPLRLHDHPPRWPRLRRGAPGPGPAAPFPLRPSEGHSRVRLYAPPRHRSNPGSERVGRETDGEVLRATEPQGLLHRRGDQGRARKTGPSPLAQLLVGRQLVQHAEGRERPGQPRAEGLARSRRVGSGRRYPVRSGWWRLRRPSASAPPRNGPSTSSPTTR